MTTRSEVQLFRFGPYELDLDRNELRKFGVRIKLERKPFHLLVALVLRAGEVVSYPELQKSLWGEHLFVNFSKGITVAVTKVRVALNDPVNNPAYIETVSGSGYRFIASVQEVAQLASDSATKNATDNVGWNRSLSQQVRQESSSRLKDHPTSESHAAAAFSKTGLHKIGFGQRSLSVAVSVVVALMVGFLVVKTTKASFLPRAHTRPIAAQLRRYVYVADYTENTIRSYSVNPANGSLQAAVKPTSRSGEHPYLAVLTSGRDFLYVANRGRADGACGSGCNVSGYAVDPAAGELVELDGSPYPAGSGPVAIAIHPSNKFVYVANVISNDIYVYARDTNGDLKKIASRKVGTHPFFVSVTPSGDFLYVSNQDDGTISAFKLNKAGDELAPVAGSPFSTGLRPRYVTIDPASHFVYVINFGVNPLATREAACTGTFGNARGRGCTISVFKIDELTGSLSEIPESPFDSDGVNPLAAAMDAEGKYLIVTNITSNNVSVYEVNNATGAIRPVPNSPFATDQGPDAIAIDWSDDFAYVANAYSHTVTQFRISNTGRLILNKSFTAGSAPIAIVAQHGSTSTP